MSKAKGAQVGKRTRAVKAGAVAVGQTRYYLRDGVVLTRSLAGSPGGPLDEDGRGLVAEVPAPDGAQEISEEHALNLLKEITGQARADRKARKARTLEARRQAYLELVDHGVPDASAQWLTGHRPGDHDEQEAGP
jgi:hypothetical protein